METQLIFERNSFFSADGTGRTLRHTERFPPCDQQEHDVCNCTRHVLERPAGQPFQVNQVITAMGQVGNRWLDLQVWDGAVNLTFLWDVPDCGLKTWRSYAHERGEIRQANHHAYFWLQPQLDSLQIEIKRPGYGQVDCMFGHLYLGTERIPKDTMNNGHCPTKLDLSAIQPDDIWAHKCQWGQEAMEVLAESVEQVMWRWLFNRAAKALAGVRPLLLDHATDVQLLHHDIHQTDLPYLYSWAADDLNHVLDRLDKTNMFKACEQVAKRADQLAKERDG